MKRWCAKKGETHKKTGVDTHTHIVFQFIKFAHTHTQWIKNELKEYKKYYNPYKCLESTTTWFFSKSYVTKQRIEQPISVV